MPLEPSDDALVEFARSLLDRDRDPLDAWDARDFAETVLAERGLWILLYDVWDGTG